MAALLAVVGFPPSPLGATTPPHRAQTPQAEYLAAAKKLDKSELAFSSLTTNAPTSRITKAALTLASAFTTFNNALKHIHFSRSMQHDVRTLETHMRADAA
jgi:hypothetical protein